jgi:hypothetical protein
MIGAVYTECRGCNKVFTHSGYARHIQTTQRIRCCTIHAASQTQDIGYTGPPLFSNTTGDEDGMAMSIDNANSLLQSLAEVDEVGATYDMAHNNGEMSHADEMQIHFY